jgi:hypothetical protein
MRYMHVINLHRLIFPIWYVFMLVRPIHYTYITLLCIVLLVACAARLETPHRQTQLQPLPIVAPIRVEYTIHLAASERAAVVSEIHGQLSRGPLVSTITRTFE